MRRAKALIPRIQFRRGLAFLRPTLRSRATYIRSSSGGFGLDPGSFSYSGRRTLKTRKVKQREQKTRKRLQRFVKKKKQLTTGRMFQREQSVPYYLSIYLSIHSTMCQTHGLPAKSSPPCHFKWPMRACKESNMCNATLCCVTQVRCP